MNEEENKEINSREDCEWFGVRTPQKPCGQCNKDCQYNAGYGKVEDYKKEIERLKEKIQNDCISKKALVCGTGNEKATKELLTANNVIQQAIKEFANKLSDRFYKLNEKPYDKLHNFEIDDLVNAEIDILLKEYGIGE